MLFALCYKSMPAQTFFFADATLISLTFYRICIKLVLPIENWVWCKKQFARGIFAPVGGGGGHSLMLRSSPNWKKGYDRLTKIPLFKQFCTNWSDIKFTELKVYFFQPTGAYRVFIMLFILYYSVICHALVRTVERPRRAEIRTRVGRSREDSNHYRPPHLLKYF